MNIIVQQKKGKEHKHYIYSLAFEIWEKEFRWQNELDDCIKLALKRHRESLPAEACGKPPIIPKFHKRKCKNCGGDLDQTEIVHYSSQCVMCWRKGWNHPEMNN